MPNTIKSQLQGEIKTDEMVNEQTFIDGLPKTRPADTSFVQTLPLGSDQALRHRFMVLNEPIPANIRFGLLLEILDKVAEETAVNYVRRFYPEARVVTAAIDRILIRNPADVT